MTSRIHGNVLVLAVVTALAACAGTPSENSGAPKKPAGTGTGYRLVSKNGEELYCRKEQATGSLTRARDLCITPAEMEARTHHDQALIHDLQNAPNLTQSNAPSP